MTEYLYHYTKLSTFLEHILPTLKLRFSKFKGSRDPYEYIPRRYIFLDAEQEVLKIEHPIIYESFEDINRYCENSLFLSFCMPKYRTENHSLQDDIIYQGYDKPRMWDQYGDGNQGICLGFNKDKLLKSFSETQNQNSEIPFNKCINDNVSYKSMKNSFFPCVFIRSVKDCENQCNRDKLVEEITEDWLFQKEIDYKDENEYRLVIKTKVDSEKKLYLDIKDSLSHIVFGDKVNKEAFSFFNDSITRVVPKQVKIFQKHWLNINS